MFPRRQTAFKKLTHPIFTHTHMFCFTHIPLHVNHLFFKGWMVVVGGGTNEASVCAPWFGQGGSLEQCALLTGLSAVVLTEGTAMVWNKPVFSFLLFFYFFFMAGHPRDSPPLQLYDPWPAPPRCHQALAWDLFDPPPAVRTSLRNRLWPLLDRARSRNGSVLKSTAVDQEALCSQGAFFFLDADLWEVKNIGQDSDQLRRWW